MRVYEERINLTNNQREKNYMERSMRKNNIHKVKEELFNANHSYRINKQQLGEIQGD